MTATDHDQPRLRRLARAAGHEPGPLLELRQVQERPDPLTPATWGWRLYGVRGQGTRGVRMPVPGSLGLHDALEAIEAEMDQALRDLDPEQTRPLLVGESNPYGANPDYALYPTPTGSSAGARLADLLELGRSAYLRAYDRVNLCQQRWRIQDARARFQLLLTVPRPAIVLLGRKVAEAAGLRDHETLTQVLLPGEVPALLIPHPSGRNRLWNLPGVREQTRILFRSLGLPHGARVEDR